MGAVEEVEIGEERDRCWSRRGIDSGQGGVRWTMVLWLCVRFHLRDV